MATEIVHENHYAADVLAEAIYELKDYYGRKMMTSTSSEQVREQIARVLFDALDLNRAVLADCELIADALLAAFPWQAERDAERVAELEAEVERLNDALDAADVRYQMLGDWGERMKAEAEEWRRVAVEQTRLERDRAEAAEVKITAIWHVYRDWMRATDDECSEDAEMILVDIREALDGGDEPGWFYYLLGDLDEQEDGTSEPRPTGRV